MAFYDIWSENPGENNQAPPFGAGEAKMTFDQITDTFRVVMSAVKQLASGTSGVIKSMAFQDRAAVDIIGGSIGGNVDVDATALKRGLIALARIPVNLTGKAADGLTLNGLQNLYNLVHPVGQVLLWHSLNPVNSFLIWPGISAVWTEIVAARNYSIVVHGTQTGLIQGGGVQPPGSQHSTGTAGGHAHSIPAHGTNQTALSAANIPPITSTDNVLAVTPGAPQNVVPKTSGLTHTGTASAGHAHSVNALNSDVVGDHAHIYSIDPLRFGFALMQRVA